MPPLIQSAALWGISYLFLGSSLFYSTILFVNEANDLVLAL